LLIGASFKWGKKEEEEEEGRGGKKGVRKTMKKKNETSKPEHSGAHTADTRGKNESHSAHLKEKQRMGNKNQHHTGSLCCIDLSIAQHSTTRYDIAQHNL
jgi:hypothetical protein